MAAKYMFLLLALFTINTCSGKIDKIELGEDSFLQRQAYALPQDIRKALDDLKTLIATSITNSFTTITNGYKTFASEVTKVMTASDTAIKTQIDENVKKITQLETILKAIPKPTTCTAGKADKIRELATTLNAALSECTDTQISGTSTTIGAQMDKVITFSEEGPKLEEELKKCGEGISAVPCLLDLQLKISEKRRSVPADIKTTTDKATASLLTATEEVKFCGFSSDTGATWSGINSVLTTLNDCKKK